MNYFNYYKYFLYFLPAEMAHNLSIFLLEKKWILPAKEYHNKMLENEVMGLKYHNPVGLAAGFDKNCQAAIGLSKQNFSHLELGTVTPKPQGGNQKPRLFRVKKHKSIINRMGFNNLGKEVFRKNYIIAKENISIPLGINIGKNKDTTSNINDYIELINYFHDIASYITINISSPNTQNLRSIQDKENINDFIKTIIQTRDNLTKYCPICLKISPDLNDDNLSYIVNCAKKYKLDALIISNTTISRPTFLENKYKYMPGGLSGELLKDLSYDKIKKAYNILKGEIPIIAVGGLSNAEDVFRVIKSGANLVQIYSSLIYNGLGLVTQINKDLVQLLKQGGFKNIKDAIGSEL